MFFVAVCFFLIAYLFFQLAYVLTLNAMYHDVVDWLRVCVQISTCALQTYIAFILYKLTYPDHKTPITNSLATSIRSGSSSLNSSHKNRELIIVTDSLPTGSLTSCGFAKSFLLEGIDERIFS